MKPMPESWKYFHDERGKRKKISRESANEDKLTWIYECMEEGHYRGGPFGLEGLLNMAGNLENMIKKEQRALHPQPWWRRLFYD